MEIPHVVESDKRLEPSEMVERLKRLERTGPHNERSEAVEQLEPLERFESAKADVLWRNLGRIRPDINPESRTTAPEIFPIYFCVALKKRSTGLEQNCIVYNIHGGQFSSTH